MLEYRKSHQYRNGDNLMDITIGNQQGRPSNWNPQRPYVEHVIIREDMVCSEWKHSECGRNDRTDRIIFPISNKIKHFFNKLQPMQRFQEESSDVARIGFQSFRFLGAQVVVDQYAPSGELYGINTNPDNLYFVMSTAPRYQFGSKVPFGNN